MRVSLLTTLGLKKITKKKLLAPVRDDQAHEAQVLGRKYRLHRAQIVQPLRKGL